MNTLTRLYVNPHKRIARGIITNPQALHATVRAAFPPHLDVNQGRVLFRLDSNSQSTILYVVGPEEPDQLHLTEQLGWASRPAVSADYSPFLDRLRVGQQWRFALRANPTHSVAGPRGTRGKVLPHVTAAHQEGWLSARSAALGFDLDFAGAQAFSVTSCEDQRFPKRDSGKIRQVKIKTVRFEGLLQVSDVELLRKTLIFGVGRAKGYGCGLLTLAKPE